MGNPVRINLPGATIKDILEAPNADVNAHLVVTESDGQRASVKKWMAPGTLEKRGNENLLPMLIPGTDDGKILVAKNGHWVAMTITQLLNDYYGLDKDVKPALMSVRPTIEEQEEENN